MILDGEPPVNTGDAMRHFIKIAVGPCWFSVSIRYPRRWPISARTRGRATIRPFPSAILIHNEANGSARRGALYSARRRRKATHVRQVNGATATAARRLIAGRSRGRSARTLLRVFSLTQTGNGRPSSGLTGL